MTDSYITSLMGELFDTPALRVAITPRLRGATSSDLFELQKIAIKLINQSPNDNFRLQKGTEALMYLIANLFSVLEIPLACVNQEINTILTGTIDINSRLAKSLNITNQQVRDWKSASNAHAKQQLVRKMVEFFK